MSSNTDYNWRCNNVDEERLMIKKSFTTFLLLIAFTSCNFESSQSEDSGGGLFSNNQAVENEFTILTPTNKTYLQGENIDILLRHPFNVSVTGVPRIAVTLDSGLVYANYVAGSGSTDLLFRYSVSAGNEDANGIEIASSIDLNGGSLKFNANGAANDANINYTALGTTLVYVDTSTPEISTITTPVAMTYFVGQQLSFQVIFNDTVQVIGTPQLALNIGGSTVYANYSSGTNTSTLIFHYNVQSSDLDLDGIAMTSPLGLNSGSIKDSNGNNVDLNFTPVSMSTVNVNGDIPYVNSITAPVNKTYNAGETIDLVLSFTESVNVTGTPQVSLDIGGNTRYLSYNTGSGTSSLTFSYIVIPGDYDTDGVILGNAIELNGGSLQDLSANDASLNAPNPLTPNVLVDALVPEVTAITPPADNTYSENDELFFTLQFNTNVTITGSPILNLVLDSSSPTSSAAYVSGSGSQNIVFKYTIVSGDFDVDGINLDVNLDLNGGTIINSQNSVSANLNISTASSALDLSGLLVDAAVAQITSLTVPADNNYITGNDLDFTVNFSKNVDVTGTPRIELSVGGSTLYADYTSGHGSSALVFRYSVLSGHTDSDGIQISNNSIDLNGGSIQDSGSQNAQVDLSSFIPDLSAVLVNAASVYITTITAPSSSTYTETQSIDFTVTSNVIVNVSGTPRIQLDIGGSTQFADYASGSGSTNLVFSFVVTPGLIDSDGITSTASIDLNGGTIQDGLLQNMALGFSAPDLTAVLVDSLEPVISSITPPSDNTYSEGQNLDFTLNTSEVITVSGTPRLTLDIGGSIVYADYVSGSGSTALLFRYLITAGDNDGDGISLSTPVDLNGGTLQNAGSQNLDLNFTAPDLSAVLVDGVIPMVTSVTPPANAVYKETQNIDFTVNFSKTINASGTPRLTLDIGGVTKYADYTSGSGSNSLVFRYTVENALEDSDGIGLNSLIDLNGGTLLDTSSNATNLDLTASTSLPNLSTVTVDSVIPTVAITYSPDITTANQASYNVSGTCSEEGRIVTVDIAGMTSTPVCTSLAWDTGALDVSGLGDNPALAITADLDDSAGNNAVQANITVNKDTATPMVAITSSPDITASNHTSYTVSGTCTDNGVIVDVNISSINIQPNCSSGTWSTGAIDVSAIADGPSISLTADHASATQASTTVSKDTVSPTVTISSAPNISLGNQTSYVSSGTCSENGVAVNVDIGGLIFTPNCSSGSWTTGLVDVSSLIDNASIALSVTHSTAPVVNITVSKNTVTPSISSLSVPTTLTNSADLNWSLNDPGGFTINDYEINYRKKGTPTWLSFADGVSTNTTTTVSSLLEATIYEFKVRVQYDTSNFSDWSSIAEGETKPDDPLFSSPYAAMNVGGATTTSVVAYYDNTAVTLNGTPIAASPLSRGQSVVITTSQFDLIDADKPIFTAGRQGSGGDGNKANMVWSPTAWAGKSFSFNATRSNPQNLYVFATENATITVKQGSTTLDTLVLSAGTGGTLSWSVYGSYQVTSTGTIMAYHMSGSGNTRNDPKPIMPGHTEIIGYPSNSMRITTDIDSTNYNLVHSNSVTASGNLDKQDVIQINPEGATTSLYRSDSLLILADQKISGASFADSNGLCASPFLPTNLMKHRYVVNADSDYVAFASKEAGTIDVFDETQDIDVDTPIETLTLTRTGADPSAPYKVRRGVTGAGYRFVATVPVAAWYHPETDTGAAANDETILYGTND